MDNGAATGPALCHLGDLTCGACCWGAAVSRSALERRFKRHADCFPPSATSESHAPPAAWRLVVHELRVRHGLDLLLAVVFRLPWIGDILRSRYANHAVCAFASFLDGDDRRVGCLLHPTRWNGRDARRIAAFRLVPGMGCGGADFRCATCRAHAAGAATEKLAILCGLRGGDWYDFSSAVRRDSRSRTEPL